MRLVYIVGILFMASIVTAQESIEIKEKIITSIKSNDTASLLKLLKEDPRRASYKIEDLTLIEYTNELFHGSTESRNIIMLLKEAQTASERNLKNFR